MAEDMALADRKSVKLSGGVFSRLGIRRVDGPRGMQITVNAKGRHQYRQRSGEGLGTLSRTPGEADRLVGRSPQAALKEMNAVRRQRGSAWMVGAGGAACTLLSACVPLSFWGHVLLALLLTGLTAVLFWRARRADARRRRFHLEYHLDADARERWTLLNHALDALTRTERLWQITSRHYARGRKRSSGASSVVTRARAILRRESPAGLTSSLTPYCLFLPPQRWLFLPDRLYVLQNGSYEAVEYAHLTVKTGMTQFMEEEEIPRDAQVVGKPRQQAASQAPQGLPITEYGVLEIEARSGPRSGLRAALHVSSVGAADQFAALFKAFQQFRPSDGPMPPSAPPSEDCYLRLGLELTCTKAEATRQFRRLVLIHHPDRVSRAHPEAGRTGIGAGERRNAGDRPGLQGPEAAARLVEGPRVETRGSEVPNAFQVCQCSPGDVREGGTGHRASRRDSGLFLASGFNPWRLLTPRP